MHARSALVLATTGAMASGSSFHGYRKSPDASSPRSEVVKAPTGVELLAGRALPESHDWRDHGGRNWVVADVNQHIPQYCGSCWIHGTVAQLNDRLKLMRHGAFPDVMLSRQALLNCVPGANHSAPPGCFGGEAVMIYEYMMETPVPDETCQVWKAKGDTCSPYTVCANCEMPPGFLEGVERGEDVTWMDFSAGCFPVDHFLGYQVAEYGVVVGADAMMREIYARGPITCSFAAPDPFMLRYTEHALQNEGVYYKPDLLEQDTDHIIEIAGWGVTPSGLEYWIGRNSWGTYWGEAGWFKIAKGINQNNIESECNWAIVKADDIDADLQGKIMGDYILGVHPVEWPSAAEASISAAAARVPAEQNSLPAPATAAALLATLSVGVLIGYLAPRRRGAPQFQDRMLG